MSRASGTVRSDSCEVSQVELRSILETAPDLIIAYNPDIEVLYFNEQARRAYREVLGVELRPGLRTYDLFPQEHRPYWDKINARVLGGETFVEEFRGKGVDGQPLIYEVTYQPMLDGDQVIGFTTFGRNVTAQRRQEDALRQAQKLEGLGVLAGGVAHDFNNLLAVMLGNLELAQRKGLASEAAAVSLDKVEKAVLRASELTRQMLVYAGRGTADVRPQDLNTVVGEIANLLESSVPKTIALRVELQSELPVIEADAGQLQQVVMNLVTNAAEAIGERAGTIDVTTALVEVTGAETGSSVPGYEPHTGRHVMLQVADTGTGMASEVLGRIFDPFFSTKAEGRGLGLCSILGILRMHGAGIRIETDVGRGSTFRIYFPVAQQREAEQSEPQPASRAQPGGVILVADDEPWVLDVTAASLESFGYEVLRARDGLEAVALFQAHPDRVSLVVLDASMPGMGGIEALSRIRAIRPRISALLCSGYSEGEILPDPRGAPTRFLQKPYTMMELAGEVDALLGTAREEPLAGEVGKRAQRAI